MKSVSIIIPAYNSSSYILKTLDSVRYQTYSNYEVVITDDGSPDSTWNTLEQYRLCHPEMSIRLIQQSNSGIGAARNTSIRASSGEILAFLDDDDIWYPEKLEKLVRYMEEHPWVQVVSHRVYKRYPDGTRRILPTSVPMENTFETLLLKGNTLAVSATAVTREAFHAAGEFCGHLKGAEDYEYWLRLASKKLTFGFIPEFLGEYTKRPGSVSVQRMEQHYEGVMEVIDRYGKVLSGKVLSGKYPAKAACLKKAVSRRKAGETASFALKLLGKGRYASSLQLTAKLMKLLF